MPLENTARGEKPTGISSLGNEWKQRAEEELNETPEVFRRELNALRRMAENDSNLTIPNNEEFLIRFLRARKFDSTKAFHMLQRYFLMKIKCPELFQCPLPSECNSVFDLQAQNMLSQRDQLGSRVYIIRMDNFDSSKVTIDDVFRTNVLALEQIVREPETQIAGIVVILDMAGLSLQHAKFFTPYYAKKMVELIQETFPLRFKGFHVVNEPFYFDAIVAVLKPFLKEKIRKRVPQASRMYLIDLQNFFFTEMTDDMILHGSDLSSLHAFISTEILPAEYGGTCGNFDNRKWYMELLAEENYFKNARTFGYKVDSDADVSGN